MTKRYLKTPEEVIRALKEGKTVETDMKFYVLKDGVLNCYAKSKTGSWWTVNSVIYDSNMPYVEEPDELKLEVGKFYKTRAGLKVVVLYIDKNGTDGCPVRVAVFDKIYDPYSVKETGEYTNCENSVWDLVAPWEEQ